MSTGDDSDARFVELLSRTQVRLRAYVLTLVRKPSDADDVLQNACMALWKKRHDYDQDRDFLRWAYGVAFVEVLRYRRKIATDKLMFNEMSLNTLATEYLQHAEELDRRRDLLPACVDKLSENDRRLLELRYRSGVTVAEISERFGRPLSTVYSSLARIRDTLYRCVQTALAQELHP